LEASFEILPSLTLSPNFGGIGTTVTVTGAGYAASSAYVVSWNATGVLCSGTTNVNGGFVCSFVIPSTVPAGTYTITGSQGTEAPTASFAVKAAVASPPSTAVSFPWWMVAVVVVGAVAGLLAVLLLRRRHPSGPPRPLEPWEDSEGGPAASLGASGPAPLSGVPTRVPGQLPSSVRGTAAASPPAPPTTGPAEDIDALIERLDKIADEMFKRKPAPEVEEFANSVDEG